MLNFDDFVCFRVLTALSSELTQVRQNGPNGKNDDPKQPGLLKNAFCSINFLLIKIVLTGISFIISYPYGEFVCDWSSHVLT